MEQINEKELQEISEIFQMIQRPDLYLWLNNYAQRTQLEYLKKIKYFLKMASEVTGKNITVEVLAEMAKINPQLTSALIVDVFKHMLASGYAQSTAAHCCETVRSFLHFIGAPRGRMPRIIRGEPRYTNPEPLTDDVVRKLEFVALAGIRGIRDAAIIAVLRQSGQRRSVLTALKWGMVKDQVMRGGIVVVNVPGPLYDINGVDVRKVKVPYRFAWGSEATRLVKEMMLDRIRKGEVIDDDSWLFRSYSERIIVNGRKRTKAVKENTRGLPMSDDAIWWTVISATKKSGLQSAIKTDRGQNIYKIQPKSFRIYFKYKLRQAVTQGVFQNFPIEFDSVAKFLMNQKPEYSGAYDKFNEDYIRELYIKLDPFITLGTASPDGQGKHVYKHKIVELTELARHLDIGYELLKELSGAKYLIRIKETTNT